MRSLQRRIAAVIPVARAGQKGFAIREKDTAHEKAKQEGSFPGVFAKRPMARLPAAAARASQTGLRAQINSRPCWLPVSRKNIEPGPGSRPLAPPPRLARSVNLEIFNLTTGFYGGD
jgi:hypothetical protein